MTALLQQQRRPLPGVLLQHAEAVQDACIQRRVLVRSGHGRLLHLERLDQRIEAHLEGLRVGGDTAMRLLREQVDPTRPWTLFAPLVLALRARHFETLDDLVQVALSDPAAVPFCVSALGWIDAPALGDVGRAWLARDSVELAVLLGRALALHCELPTQLRARIGHALVRAPRSDRLATLAACGALEALDDCRAALHDARPEELATLACAAVMLGDRHGALDRLLGLARDDLMATAPQPLDVLQWALRAGGPAHGRAVLSRCFSDTPHSRAAIRAVGAVGDPAHVPWLLERARNAATSRAAGEALALLTGVDLAAQSLERPAPDDASVNGDDGLDVDDDDGLPWPDPDAVAAWWSQAGGAMTAHPVLLRGTPPSRDGCVEALLQAPQRQRRAAAIWWCLLQPGTPLFPVDAPAGRQRQALAGTLG